MCSDVAVAGIGATMERRQVVQGFSTSHMLISELKDLSFVIPKGAKEPCRRRFPE